ncbi:DUF7344 domain-containing protein [Halosimplex salinum]|uniref:DUF7344 domain-containing protein n=1 Tax=Halosimplex salinum TaxID=1710538 RepID=UPI000F473A4D|nr:hypothetical protein [Halosimplex salinum]
MIGASELFGILADDMRRRLLLLLFETEPVTVPDGVLTRSAAASPTARADGRGSHQSRRTVEVRLYHVHLPKLVAAGVVEWEREANLVRRGPEFEAVEPLLELLSENAAKLPQEVY